MIYVVAVLALLAAPSFSAAATLPMWGQCGGKSGICGKKGAGPCEDAVWSDYTCPDSFECKKDTEWYYQCLPTWETSSGSSSSGQPYKPVNGILPPWGQCGGKSGVCGQSGWGPCQDKTWSGLSCPGGFTCTRDTEWYYQCLPNEISTEESSMEESSASGSSYMPVNGVIPQWGQCGGKAGVCGQDGWGPCEDKVWDSPSCPAGFTCTKDTQWYYQCLPEGQKTPKRA